MFQADLYTHFNNLQRADINKVLNNSMKLLKWNKDGNDMVLDLGCGTGDVTKDILLQKFPNFKGIVGVDLSTEMLNFAKEHNSHEKIQYKELDLADRGQISKDLLGCFDHAFSFHVFHWIKNQKQLFKNIYEMLKPGGDLLSLFVINTDVMLIYEKLSTYRKWSKYLHNVFDIFPYQHCADPLASLEEVLSNAGFSYIVQFEKREFVYATKEDFKISMEVINPFIRKIPEEDRAEFMDDFAQIAEELHFYADDNDQGEVVIVPYNLAVLYLRKPEQSEH